jgi:HEAT repeat protein
VAGLRSACAHPDPGIRRGALLALSRLDREQTTAAALVALRDPESSLRREALELLRGAFGREVDVALAAFVESRPPREERLAAVEVLARRRTGPARVTLQRLARRRLWASGATREMRRAARRALGGGGR